MTAASGQLVLDMVTNYFAGKTLKAMIVKTALFDKDTVKFRSDIATTEVAATAQYLAGGVTLTGVAVQIDTVNDVVELVADHAAFGISTFLNGQAMVTYISTGNAATDRVLGVHSFGNVQNPDNANFTYLFASDSSLPSTKGVVATFAYVG